MKRPVMQRIAERSTPEPTTGCWLWTGSVDNEGYATLKDDQRRILKVSRILLGLPHGGGPTVACHKCDTPLCVNPQHLFRGAPGDNSRDRDQKRRHAFRERHGMAKLTESTSRHVKVVLGTGVLSQEKIAALFGVSPATISRVKTGVAWA